MSASPERLFRSPQAIIGREGELAVIEQAITSIGALSRVLYFEGQGGIGKTRLLIEARNRSQQQATLLTGDVIDLYLTRYHQPISLMGAIVASLRASLPAAEAANAFETYLQLEAQVLAARAESAEHEHEQRVALDRAFLSDYTTLASRYQIILLFDTFEKLYPQISETEAFNFRQTSRLQSWLVDLLTRLPNTLALIAGRPRPRQRYLLETAFGARLDVLQVQPFGFAETDAYIRTALSDALATAPEMIEMLHRACAGRPVVLAIALACAQAHAFDLSALPAGFGERYPENRTQLSDAFVSLIVGDLQTNRPDFADMLTRAVYLRKGLRAPLLAAIERQDGQQPDQALLQAQLEGFAQYPFVKQTDSNEIMLHDEMYELLFGKLGDRDAPRWYAAAVAHLEAELAHLTQQAPGGQRTTYHIQHIQTLQVERLFYELSRDLRSGYQHYRELGNTAINARDEDFDTQLQDEFARFFDPEMLWGRFYRRQLELSGLSWEQIAYDEGIRWVYRRIAAHLQGTNRYLEAIAIAERVQAQYPQIYQNNRLARSALDAARLQAEVYIPETAARGAEIAQNYERLVHELEALQLTAPADIQEAGFVLANAYNYWGYFERTQGRLQSAIDKYKRAIKLYKDLGPEVDSLRATTLNNLGFALARQGASRRGLQFAQEALRIVTAQGLSYAIATTLNTIAHIQMDISEVGAALENVTRARALFEEVQSVRGRALCALAEGRVRSRVAALWQSGREQDHEYQRAIGSYREAIGLFDYKIAGELSRRIEARVFTSKVYRDWAMAHTERGRDGSQQADQALDLLREAEALCTAKTPLMIRVSILEPSAVVYVDQARYAEARAVLAQARALIPADYDIRPGEGVLDTQRTQELRIYWLRLAQIELQYALCGFGEGQPAAGCRHLLRAFACLLTFSPQAGPVTSFRSIGKRELIRVGSVAYLGELRDQTRQAASELHIDGEPLAIVEAMFEEALEDLSLF